LNATGAPGPSADFCCDWLIDLFCDEFQAIMYFYSIPSNIPTAPHATPKAIKPAGGDIKNVPMLTNSINEAINMLAMVFLWVIFERNLLIAFIIFLNFVSLGLSCATVI
jgi:hypothetical protein